MRALQALSSLETSLIRTARCNLPAARFAAHRRSPVPVAAASRTLCCASTSGGNASGSSGSSASSSGNGWLLDPAPSLASSTSSSSNGSTELLHPCGFDAIMMLGGGLLPDGGLPEWVQRRLDGALHLYAQQVEAQALQAKGGLRGGDKASSGSGGGGGARPPAIVLLGAGTPHKPPVIDSQGYVLHESTAYADYLLSRGVPAGNLYKEAQSYDTVGNGYFSLLMHALPAGWRRIAVVTSDFHMPRTQATFDSIYGLAGRQLHGDATWFELHYRPVSDEGIFPADVLAARAEKEAAAVAAWHRNTAGIATLADLHGWLYATHLCYSVSRQQEFGREQELDPKLAATY